MIQKTSRQKRRRIIHRRIRRKVFGTPDRPRLCVFRSARHIGAQVVDDARGMTLLQVSTMSKEFRERNFKGKKTEAAKLLGALIAERALAKGIRAVAFDRGGYQYHGRVKALADAAREKGLQF
jgi:large subunit ribosomal protein L18